MNILVIRTHRFGDIIQLTPMLRGLKLKYPESHISFITGKDFFDLLDENPDVDEIISIPEKEYRYWLKSNPEKYPEIFNEMYDLVEELRGKKFDIVVNRQYEWGAILAYLIGAKNVLGGAYSPERGFYFQDQTSHDLFEMIRKDRKANKRNLVDWACLIAGVPVGRKLQMLFRPSSFAHKKAKMLLTDNKRQSEQPLVAVQMGAAKSFRQWGVENLAEIIHWLIKDKEKKVVLIGGKDEKFLGEQLERILGPFESMLINLIGKTSLKTLGAVLERCECLITGDTGSMHLAASVGTPVFAIFFGTAYPWETGPYGLYHFVLYSNTPCAPCLDPAQCEEGHRCKKEIKPDIAKKAFNAATQYWKNENMKWKPEANGIKLFITSRSEEGEQILVPLEDMGNLPIQSVQRSPDEKGIARSQLDTLLMKGDEVILSFLEGDAERGFSNIVEYLDYWIETKDAMVDSPETEKMFSVLLERCLMAMKSRDVVTLMDAVEYGYKPLIERALMKKQYLNIGSDNACI